jgi:hypothetical protein
MSMSKHLRVPEPAYVEEHMTGTLVALNGNVGAALYVGLDSPSDSPVVTRGALVIRYAIPLITPPGNAIIPGLFISERGGILIGRECWDYLQTRFQMHPRADVIGLTVNGSQAQALVRELDFGAAVRILAYADPPNAAPLAEVKRLYTADSLADGLPELLERYRPHG